MGFSVGMKLVMVAALLMVIAAVLLFVFRGSSGDFTGLTSNQTDAAQCGAMKVDYELACDCERQVPQTDRAKRIKQEAGDKNCDWVTEVNYACGADYCPSVR